jgi:RNA processing factor Prp31
MTAEQAIEAAKGLTFEAVWAAMMETRARMEESNKRADDRFEEAAKQLKASQEENAKQLKASQEETAKQLRASQEKTEKIVAELSKNMGDMRNSLGRLIEAMFTADLRSKFNKLGYVFTRMTCRTEYADENDQVITEVDAILENGEYILLAEVKTEMRKEYVDDHLERIEKVRQYMDNHNDARKIIGAVAGGIVPESVLRYAQKKGLFVIVQSGDSSTIAKMPKGFKERTW